MAAGSLAVDALTAIDVHVHAHPSHDDDDVIARLPGRGDARPAGA